MIKMLADLVTGDVPFIGSNFVTEPLKSGPSQGPLTLLLSKPIE